MTFSHTLLVVAWVSLGVMAVTYLFAVRTKDIGMVDVGWTAGLGLAGGLSALLVDGVPWRRALIGLMLSVWALRLARHILVHRIIGKQEDGRYAMLREYWGHRTVFYVPMLFALESLLIPLFAAPVVVAMLNPTAAPGLFDALGAALWIAAVTGETFADGQLESFRDQPQNKGKTCRDGLWRYSRHPNYFFEWVHWWAYVALAIGADRFLLSLLGPALMFLFLYKVTGIPHTERRAVATRGEDYRSYQRTTNMFFPWFPRTDVT